MDTSVVVLPVAVLHETVQKYGSVGARWRFLVRYKLMHMLATMKEAAEFLVTPKDNKPVTCETAINYVDTVYGKESCFVNPETNPMMHALRACTVILATEVGMEKWDLNRILETFEEPEARLEKMKIMQKNRIQCRAALTSFIKTDDCFSDLDTVSLMNQLRQSGLDGCTFQEFAALDVATLMGFGLQAPIAVRLLHRLREVVRMKMNKVQSGGSAVLPPRPSLNGGLSDPVRVETPAASDGMLPGAPIDPMSVDGLMHGMALEPSGAAGSPRLSSAGQ